MATMSANTGITFESIKEEILRKFEKLHQKLDERKEALLSKLVALQKKALDTTELDETVAKLKQAKEFTMSTLRGNVVAKENVALEKTFADQIKEVETRKQLQKSCQVLLRCCMNKLEECILQIDLVDKLSSHENKAMPLKKGEFNSPRGICIDNTTSHVYVADSGNNRIQVVTEDGLYVREFGADKLTDPWDVTLSELFIFVTDVTQHTIVQFSRDGTFIRCVGGKGKDPLKFNAPRGLSAYKNKLYVCDVINNRIQILDMSLNFETEITAHVFINNANFKGLYFSLYKQYLSHCQFFPTALQATANIIYVVPESGNMILLFTQTSYTFLQTVILDRKYNMKVHLYFAIDSLNNYIISAQEENKIYIFDKNGKFKQTLSKENTNNPTGIALSNNNIVCVTGDAKFLILEYSKYSNILI